MEQIYTIPVNEAFEASRDDPSLGCPFWRLYNKLEQDDGCLRVSIAKPLHHARFFPSS